MVYTKFFWLLALLSILSCTGTSNNKVGEVRKMGDETNEWIYNKTDGQILYFQNNKKLVTSLYDVKYITQLPANHKAPFIVFSGKSCQDCDENIAIYIHSPDDSFTPEKYKYTYPGKIYDYLSNELIFESKMYYGSCIDSNFQVVWEQKEINNDNTLNESIFVVQIKNDTLEELVLEKNFRHDKNFKSDCSELKGIDVASEP